MIVTYRFIGAAVALLIAATAFGLLLTARHRQRQRDATIAIECHRSAAELFKIESSEPKVAGTGSACPKTFNGVTYNPETARCFYRTTTVCHDNTGLVFHQVNDGYTGSQVLLYTYNPSGQDSESREPNGTFEDYSAQMRSLGFPSSGPASDRRPAPPV